MKAYKISDLKNFMNKLLLSEGFDYFLLEEGTIITYNSFQIDGRIQTDFYTKEEQEVSSLCSYDFSLWKEMRPLCFQLIKGKRTPLSFTGLRFVTTTTLFPFISSGVWQDATPDTI